MKPRKISRANRIKAATKPAASDVSNRASRNVAVSKVAKGRTSAAAAMTNQTTARPLEEHPARRVLDPATRKRKADNKN